ncbi:hypothetical protein [Haliangium ochraceum]|uniref:Uncharacterized protein n=1 Tax=Haliangium ochraceum (strain DSM 14365 / JCM 11303 / SMP-2) TaxID=502025 RepID=D0LUD1_HALO1|nr:hypothetical protein [Haliangium ochraceum]ACY19254.1 hypothetical protein Hoch_6790 [Haliangium ochraceum DSM 14365]
MKLTVLPFRPGDTPATLDHVAELLVAALPERDRKTALNLLVNRILPVKLAGIEVHPKPDRLASIVHRDLARTLSGKPPNMRLHALQVAALEADILAIGRDALHIAIARYLVDTNADPGNELLMPWIKPEVEELRTCSVDVLARRAEARIRSLRAWQDRVRGEYPAEWARARERYIQVRGWLVAAETGEFEGVTGNLDDFLRDAQARERRGP